VKNYLDPFHIPFVHKELTSVLDINQYKTEIYDKYNLQIGYSSDGEDCFEIPEGHQDFGSKISAYYYWIFPNIMLNFYPWGLSINIVTPININRTKISFIQFMIDETKYNSGAGGLIDKVEREDEFVVEQVSKGLESRYYKTGRFSAVKEEAIHHFHTLISDYL
jgi:choline monooxygenase